MTFYGRIFSYFRGDRRLLAALVALIWVTLLADTLQPYAIAALVDRVLSGDTSIHWGARLMLQVLPAGKTAQIIGLALIWLLLALLLETGMLLRAIVNARIQYNGTARVRGELFDHLQRLSPSYHRSVPQGDSIYRLSTDSLGFFGTLDTFIGAANSMLTLLVICAVMLGWNVRITVVALFLAPLLVMANSWFSRTIRRTSAASKQADSDLTTFIQRAMTSIGLIQLFGRQQTESRRFRGAIDHTIGAGMKMSWQQQLFPWSQRIIFGIGYAFVLGYGGYLVYRGELLKLAHPFTVGGVLAMTYYLGRLWEPLRRITGFTADVQTNAAACARVFHVLDVDPTVRDAPDAQPLTVRPRTLELNDVGFAYGPDRPVLRGINARIEPGELVAFVGPSGAGKSTLLNLLPRFYDPQRGSLTLDGHDLRSLRVADVRRHIALVPQDSPAVAGTVGENIAFGAESATAAQIRHAARLAGAASFIEQLPQGYDTPLTEAGQNLSGGQRQRLAIARALLTAAPILVLDEPTSGLDRRHEHLLLRTLQRLRGRHTIILVTHSLAAAAICDRVYFLDTGTVAEQGTHEELLTRGGAYAALAAMPHLARTDRDEHETHAA